MRMSADPTSRLYVTRRKQVFIDEDINRIAVSLWSLLQMRETWQD